MSLIEQNPIQIYEAFWKSKNNRQAPQHGQWNIKIIEQESDKPGILNKVALVYLVKQLFGGRGVCFPIIF